MSTLTIKTNIFPNNYLYIKKINIFATTNCQSAYFNLEVAQHGDVFAYFNPEVGKATRKLTDFIIEAVKTGKSLACFIREAA